MRNDDASEPTSRPPRLAVALLRAALPPGERGEVLGDLAAEHAARRRAAGRLRAGWWVWRQVAASVPALLRRGWWRGWSGFETRSERLRPGGMMLESWAIDTRFATRRLRRRPLYTVLTVLTLALGVAGMAAVYGVAERLLLSPLPVRAEDEVVVFWFEQSWSEADFTYLRPHLGGFRGVAAYRPADATLQTGDAPAGLVPGVAASAELFDVLGATPALGSTFRPGDDHPGAERVVVLGHSLWQELGGRASIVGDRLLLSGVPRTVVGVMPEGFWFPDPSVRMWLSQPLDPENRSGNYSFVGRLPPGASIAAMDVHVDEMCRLLDERFDYPEQWDPTRDPELVPLRERVLGSARPALLALLGAMAAILLVACVNVAALMLGQVDGRATEMAMRRALGAGRRRLLQQLVVESLLVGALAGVVGAGLAVAGFRFLVAALPLGALAEAATLHWTLFGAAIVVAMIAATAVAVAPCLSVARSDLRATISRGRTGGVAGRGGRLEHGLVVGQVALVLLLTASAALLVRSVESYRAIDPGVDAGGVAVVDVQAPATIEDARLPGLVAELVASVEALPGVASAAAAQKLPLRGSGDNWGIEVEGRPDVEWSTTAFRVVTPGYFATMGIRVASGRGLQDTDRDPDASEGVVVINEELARRYFPGEDPLGRRIRFMDRWDRIVGVVENVAEEGLSAEPVPARYVVAEQVPYGMPWQSLVVRAEEGLDPATLLDPARRAIQATAPGVAVRELTTMTRVLDRAIGPTLQVMSLLSVLAGLALVLGAIGIYGVVSHFVTRRKRDWGIRIALGLRPVKVAGHIVARGVTLIALGLVVGLVAFRFLARLLERFLYGVGASDPVAIAAAAAVLLAAGLLAASVPARRASRVDPAVVLREN